MIYSIVEPTAYQSNTTALAIPEVCRLLNKEHTLYHLHDFRDRKIVKDNNADSVWILEAAFAFNSGWTMKELRQYLPNGKVVVMGGDTVWYINEKKIEGIDPKEVDLWLDLMPCVVEQFKSEGIKCDLWKWTVSEVYIKRIENWLYNRPVETKSRDLMCLMTLNDHYRKRLNDFLKESGIYYELGRGVFSSHHWDLWPAYSQSWVILGSSSPAWTHPHRTMKGWRDWMAPFLGTVLIYDDHPAIIEYYGGSEVLPLYPYEYFPGIIDWIRILKDNPIDYQHWLDKQKKWALENTLEIQLTNLFKRYEIL